MYLFIFYVPPSHLESVKDALFQAGAGQIGTYSHCAWQVLGQGQFCPQSGSQPFLGQQGQLKSVDEYRVELVCQVPLKAKVTQALLAAHPYETPAFHWVKLDLSQE